jgi:hypothetical protein
MIAGINYLLHFPFLFVFNNNWWGRRLDVPGDRCKGGLSQLEQ